MNRVFLNDGDCTPGDCGWREVAGLLGMDLPLLSQMGVVPGDIDNDGDLDVSLLSRGPDEPNFLFRNEARGNNWVQFRLTGTLSNRDAVGARVRVTARLQPGTADVDQIREVVAGTGFFSDMPRIQTFGLGKAGEVISARIRWPSGQIQDFGPLAVNQRYDITEPSARLRWGRQGWHRRH
ncbi:MAG: ASPIC/UnbV domain-containing protein [Acidobacteriota bacterium]